MKPILYRKILKLVEQDQLQSITIDLFDTILLRSYWPESLRNLELAELWLPQLRQQISSSLTAYEVYDWYRFAKQLLADSSQTLRFDLAIETTVSLLCHKYNVALTREQQLELLITLISDELNFTIENTKVNRHLLAQLSTIKQLAPKVKVYFVTNTHLTSDQLKTLLQITNITIFDGGICTADLEQPASSFTNFTRDLLKDTPINANFHISAEYQSCRSALDSGSLAFHYRPVRLRGLRTLAGQAISSASKFTAILREHSRYHNSIDSITETNAIAGQLAHFWHAQLSTQLELCTNATFLLPGDGAIPDEHPNLISTPDLTEATILRAFIWLLANHTSTRWDSASLLKLLVSTAQIPNRLALYQLCYEAPYITSEFIINSRDESTFYASFLDEIRNNSPENIELLRQSYITAAQYLPRDDKKLFFINLTHDNSAWLFREFARLHELDNTIIDWRPAGIPSNLPVNFAHQASTTSDLSHTELAPDLYLSKILQPRISRLKQL